jgi:hypothetical protein
MTTTAIMVKNSPSVTCRPSFADSLKLYESANAKMIRTTNTTNHGKKSEKKCRLLEAPIAPENEQSKRDSNERNEADRSYRQQ